MDGLTKGRILDHAGMNQMHPCRLHNLPNEGLQLVECSWLFRVAFIINRIQRLVMVAVWGQPRKNLEGCDHGLTGILPGETEKNLSQDSR
jgi:hypothetical protein